EFEEKAPVYPAVGYFKPEPFDPATWVPSYPNPAYDNATLRDAFWGAKRVVNFTDDDVRAIVDEGEITDPEARAYLVQTLISRRDQIGRYWFGRINPLDRFVLVGPGERPVRERTRLVGAEPAPVAASNGGETGGEAGGAPDGWALHFDDLAVWGGLEDAVASRYTYIVYHGDDRLAGPHVVDEAAVPLPALPEAALRSTDPDDRVLRVELRTLREGRSASKRTGVYVHVPAEGRPRLVGIEREE
ncbi:MAG: hypothetical protein R3362_10925, partial [Rhodothermales bacterium]|nr:hypothetical protein [Rhodothermales bacterium]